MQFQNGRAVLNEKIGWFYKVDWMTDVRQWALELGYMDPDVRAIKIEPTEADVECVLGKQSKHDIAGKTEQEATSSKKLKKN